MDNSELCSYAHGENDQVCKYDEKCNKQYCIKKHFNKEKKQINKSIMNKNDEFFVQTIDYNNADDIYFYGINEKKDSNENLKLNKKYEYIKEIKKTIEIFGKHQY